MPFLRVHVGEDVPTGVREELARALREALVAGLGVRNEVGHVLILPTPASGRRAGPGRRQDFVFGEILMYEGRPPQVKQALLARLHAEIARLTGVPETDIVLVIVEMPAVNWFGGLPPGVPGVRPKGVAP